MRRRVLLADAAAPDTARLRRAALLAAACGYVAALGAMGARGVLAGPAAGAAEALAIAVVLLAPIPRALGRARLRRFLGFDPPPASVLLALTAVGILVLTLRDPAIALPAALCALQGHLLVALDDDRAAAWSPVVAVFQVLTALSVAPSAYGALLVPLVLIAAIAAVLLLLTRVTRRSVARGALGAALPPETHAGADRRLLYALPLAALLLVVGLAAAPLTTTPPWRLLRGDDVAAGSERDASSRRRRGGRGDDAGRAMSFSSDIVLDGIPMPAYEVLMEVVPRDRGVPLGDIGPLYLRGVVLSQFTDRGVRMRGTHAPTRYRDGDDGVLDGVVTLRDARPGETIDLEISHYPLPIEPQGWNLLFSVEPTFSVSLPDVRYDPDRLLVSSDVPGDWFSYTVAIRRPDAPRAQVRGAPAVHPDTRYVQLPPPSPALARIAAEGRRVTAGATSDLGRVQRLVAHFRGAFEYSLEDTTFAGAAGLSEFLARRSGYCAQFASVCVLMLREQGLAARVVSGFRASEWSREQAAYQVRPRDTHAWFEVYFEGAGWLPFDATPPDALRRALLDAAAAAEPGAASWASDLLDGIGSLALSPGDAATPREILALLRAAPRSVKRLFVIALGLLLAAAITARLLPSLRRAGRGRSRDAREVEDIYARLLRALARHGYHKRPAATPREFARTVAHAGGGAFRPLRGITEQIYAARFGGRPLEPAARADIAAFLGALGAQSRVPAPPGGDTPAR